MDKRFDGIKNLYGEDGFKKIQSAHFLIIGIGGVGSWICESLARSGATEITLVDLDDICFTNINRQIHSLEKTVGSFKVDAMKERLLAINPQLKVHAIQEFFTEKTQDLILNKDYTFVFDAIDSLKSKTILVSECKKRNLPLVCVGASGAKVDPSKIQVIDLNKTINDPLLSRLRKNLRRYYGFSKYPKKKYGIPTVFSTELPVISSCATGSMSNCQNGLGSASFITATFGFHAVSYALNKITGRI